MLALHLFKRFTFISSTILAPTSRIRLSSISDTGYWIHDRLTLTFELSLRRPIRHLRLDAQKRSILSLFARILGPLRTLRKRTRLAIILHDRFSIPFLRVVVPLFSSASRSRHRIVYGFSGTYSEIGGGWRSVPLTTESQSNVLFLAAAAI
jgi:hypothetical protein